MNQLMHPNYRFDFIYIWKTNIVNQMFSSIYCHVRASVASSVLGVTVSDLLYFPQISQHVTEIESKSVSHSVVSNFYNHMDCSPQVPSGYLEFAGRILEWVSLPRDLHDPGLSRVSCIVGGYFYTLNHQRNLAMRII